MKHGQLETIKYDNKGTTRIMFKGFYDESKKQDTNALIFEAKCMKDMIEKDNYNFSEVEISSCKYSCTVYLTITWARGEATDGRKELSKIYKEYWESFKADFPE